jgi:hypothetical protein
MQASQHVLQGSLQTSVTSTLLKSISCSCPDTKQEGDTLQKHAQALPYKSRLGDEEM